MAEKTLEDAF